MKYKNLYLLILAFAMIFVQAAESASDIQLITGKNDMMCRKNTEKCLKKLVSYLTEKGIPGDLITMLDCITSKLLCSAITYVENNQNISLTFGVNIASNLLC